MNRSRCLRTTLVACNVALLLIGGVAFGTGVWVFVEHDDLMNYLNKQISNIGALVTSVVCLLLVLGVAAIVVAVFGFYQSGTNAKRLHQIYSGVVWSVAVCATLLVWTNSYTFNTSLYTDMQQLLQNKYSSHFLALGAEGAYEYSYENDETLAADIVQLKFGCCGVINGSDYSNATSWNRKVSGSNATMIIPVTCCRMNGGPELSGLLKLGTSGNLTLFNSTCPFTSYDSNINKGCYNAVAGALRTIFLLINFIGYGALSVQTVSYIVALLVCRSEFNYEVLP